MRADTKDALDWTLDYLSRLISALTGRLSGASFVNRAAFRAMARELSELEACARRTLVVFALYLFETGAVVLPKRGAAPPPPASDPGHAALSAIHVSGEAATRDQGKTALSAIHREGEAEAGDQGKSHFPLLEPLPRYSFEPQNWWDTLTPSDRPKDARPLQRRLAALGALLADPEAAARRMARQIARIRSRKLRRTVAIRPGQTNWRGDPLKDVFASIASDMNGRAITGLNALGP